MKAMTLLEVAVLLIGAVWSVVGGHFTLPGSLAEALDGLQLVGLIVGGLVAAGLLALAAAIWQSQTAPPWK